MSSPQNQIGGSPNPDAPSPTSRRSLPRAAGVVAVLACLILPLILLGISITGEQTAGENAAQEMLATATAGLSQTPAPNAQARPHLLDQHYYFVNGCVSAPVDCGKANGGTWGEYYTELGRLYNEAAA